MNDDLRRRFFYSIEGLTPRGDLTLGGFGFGAYLDKDFAKKAYETELPETNRLNEIAETILVDSRLIKKGERFYHSAYNFVRNKDENQTCLLHYATVPGDACDLGIDGSDLSHIREGRWDYIGLDGAVEYGPHNVDSHLQAYALLSLFTTWAYLTSALLDYTFIEEQL